MLTEAEYGALRAVAASVHPLFELALVLAHETGHRLGSLRLVRWSDVDAEGRAIRWRAENDKIGFEHTTALTDEAVAALEAERRRQPTIGDTWIFPAPRDASLPCAPRTFLKGWARGEELAKLAPAERRGWHSLRRKFATELKAVPLNDLCHLGGWKSERTVLTCYQRPDDATMRGALAMRQRARVEVNAEADRRTQSAQ
jgi:integrase